MHPKIAHFLVLVCNSNYCKGTDYTDFTDLVDTRHILKNRVNPCNPCLKKIRTKYPPMPYGSSPYIHPTDNLSVPTLPAQGFPGVATPHGTRSH